MKKKFQKQINSDKESMRIATPELVASYRAKKLKCDSLAEIGAGIGGQTLSFAKECKKVIAVEIDEKKAEFLKTNLEENKITNVEIIIGDAIENANKLSDSQVIFCDPSRPHEEKVRSIETVSPSPNELLKNFPNKTLAIELPPQISPEKLDFKAQKEYLSVNYRLNRLTLYFSPKFKESVTVVSLPSGESLSSDMSSIELKQEKLGNYIYELDTGIEKAGLQGQLAKKFPVFLYKKSKYTILTSDTKVSSAFLKCFHVLAWAETLKEAKDKLRLLKAGKAILHGRIPPDEYWVQRNQLENGLAGKRNLHVFYSEEGYIISSIDL